MTCCEIYELIFYTLKMIPNVRDVLDLPVVRAGRPRVVSASGYLDRPVRWVHISESTDLTELLEGGELVLSTGLPLLGEKETTVAYLRMLADLRVAGLIVELGTHLDSLPEVLPAAAESVGVPVVALDSMIRFVDVTQHVHRLIVADQYEEAEFARTTHEVFTSLNIARASTTDIVARASEILAAPLVLEDVGRRVLAYSTAGVETAALLENWAERSREHDVDNSDTTAWSTVPLGVGTEKWGRLVLPVRTANTGRARMVLERAAQSLQLHRMIQAERDALIVHALSGLLDDLAGGRITDDAEASTRASALGLTTGGGYIPLVVRIPRNADADALTRGEVDRRLLFAVRQAVGDTGHTALASLRRDGTVAAVLSCAAVQQADIVLERVAGTLGERLRGRDGTEEWVAGSAPATARLITAASRLAEAEHVADAGATMPESNRLYRSTDVRLRGLISLLRDDHHVQAFAEAELGRLLRHDTRHGENLTMLLRAHLESAGSKADTARRSGLSRPTLYTRLHKIERILGVSLDSAESRTSLHTALMIVDTNAET